MRVNSTAPTSHPCSDIEGVDMLKPRLSVNIIEPSYLQEEYNGELICKLGRYVEAEFPLGITPVFINQSEEDYRCHMFGVLMYELFLQSSEVITGGDDASLVNGGSALYMVKSRSVGSQRFLLSFIPFICIYCNSGFRT